MSSLLCLTLPILQRLARKGGVKIIAVVAVQVGAEEHSFQRLALYLSKQPSKIPVSCTALCLRSSRCVSPTKISTIKLTGAVPQAVAVQAEQIPAEPTIIAQTWPVR